MSKELQASLQRGEVEVKMKMLKENCYITQKKGQYGKMK